MIRTKIRSRPDSGAFLFLRGTTFRDFLFTSLYRETLPKWWYFGSVKQIWRIFIHRHVFFFLTVLFWVFELVRESESQWQRNFCLFSATFSTNLNTYVWWNSVALNSWLEDFPANGLVPLEQSLVGVGSTWCWTGIDSVILAKCALIRNS